MLLTLSEIKAQLKLDEDFTDEDALLTLFAKAAQRRTESFLNRRLYVTAEEMPAGDATGLILPEDVRLAMLMLVTHFYENRSAVTEVEKNELPVSFNWLVGPYRYIPL